MFSSVSSPRGALVTTHTYCTRSIPSGLDDSNPASNPCLNNRFAGTHQPTRARSSRLLFNAKRARLLISHRRSRESDSVFVLTLCQSLRSPTTTTGICMSCAGSTRRVRQYPSKRVIPGLGDVIPYIHHRSLRRPCSQRDHELTLCSLTRLSMSELRPFLLARTIHSPSLGRYRRTTPGLDLRHCTSTDRVQPSTIVYQSTRTRLFLPVLSSVLLSPKLHAASDAGSRPWSLKI
ncbi:hypothetical protein C8Q80DRAFT_206568 [Daedaleopsis nitida]|nr:hypothetical protein C8Q80DRAFT_206568 [Daedaleopsis nitida]